MRSAFVNSAIFTTALIAACVGGLGLRQSVSRAADEPITPKPITAEDFELRYAEATLKLAEVDLRKIEGANAKVPGTFSPAALEPLRQSVALGHKHVEQARAHGKASEYDSYVAVAEAGWKIASLEYQKASAAQARVGTSVDPNELERLRLTAQVAELRYERALGSSQVPESLRLRWQVEELRDEVLRLRARVEALTRRN